MTTSLLHSADSLAASAGLASLAPSPRMPVLFLGHGSPMNAIEDNAYHRSWQQLGQSLIAQYGKPQLVLCVSAHWLTRDDWQLTGMEFPRTIHDFGGFPPELFAQQYPAPGAPAAALELAQWLNAPQADRPVLVDALEWGLDHGTWGVLKPMFPDADIPVMQLSLVYRRSPQEHFAFGQQLRTLRERGVLIVGSGNIVHNLRALANTESPLQTYDWSQEFDDFVTRQIEQGDLGALARFQDLGRVAQMAHPTHDHFLPLLHAAGAVHDGETPRFFNADFQMASISMRSVIWGA
ncbi:4,5-DOPA dioxygenase extradiol [Diaphorobacter ruginosibacter]|uniref:4,5-DOPA dioxygenase extradiol n=1 Tax=Diaphorobacter ruginosibacter TaxID=1715720 RepID=A0A7G9RPY1_9BURK|nr:4,5-DOPA dioxygenase extradiol [Diaphorobacter ruginosibacter]QNN57656.1 4,5-DOPA dioxygenase extradiol [Diaphorobacter ruginosibacter]